MFKSIRNWILIFLWELIFLLKSIPYLSNLNKRVGPSFIIIGASKSGTTSLYRNLDQHPNIKMARRKETHFFNRYYKFGIAYYRTYFPLKKEGRQSGEATTSYLYERKVPERIKKHFLEMKFILLLRDPVYRAYSHFQMNKKDDSSRNFLEALKKEKRGEVVYNYIESSLYAKQISRWFDHFPANQFKIIKSEAFFNNPHSTMNKIYQFLELKEYAHTKYAKSNQNKYPELTAEEYREAERYFKKDMESLKAKLGGDFIWNYQT